MVEAHNLLTERERRMMERRMLAQSEATAKMLAAVQSLALRDQIAVLRCAVVLLPDVLEMQCTKDWIKANAHAALSLAIRGEF